LPGLSANITYFYHPAGAGIYFRFCHRNDSFRARWQAATGSWDDKIIGDIGCGPGNVFATVGGNPRLLIGVDVARGSLEMARAVGYLTRRSSEFGGTRSGASRLQAERRDFAPGYVV